MMMSPEFEVQLDIVGKGYHVGVAAAQRSGLRGSSACGGHLPESAVVPQLELPQQVGEPVGERLRRFVLGTQGARDDGLHLAQRAAAARRPPRRLAGDRPRRSPARDRAIHPIVGRDHHPPDRVVHPVGKPDATFGGSAQGKLVGGRLRATGRLGHTMLVVSVPRHGVNPHRSPHPCHENPGNPRSVPGTAKDSHGAHADPR